MQWGALVGFLFNRSSGAKAHPGRTLVAGLPFLRQDKKPALQSVTQPRRNRVRKIGIFVGHGPPARQAGFSRDIQA